MFKNHNITPGTFNVICAPITQMATRPSDHQNGYYIVDGLWGSCFTRIATKKEHFEIVANNNPRCPHTYTKVPGKLAERTYFMYINYRTGYTLHLPAGAIVVGMHQAQPHRVGGWYSQSVLVYSPSGTAPTAEESPTPLCDTSLVHCTTHKGTTATLSVEQLTSGFPIRYLHLNAEGYYQPRAGRSPNAQPIQYTPATYAVADFMGPIL